MSLPYYSADLSWQTLGRVPASSQMLCLKGALDTKSCRRNVILLNIKLPFCNVSQYSLAAAFMWITMYRSFFERRVTFYDSKTVSGTVGQRCYP